MPFLAPHGQYFGSFVGQILLWLVERWPTGSIQIYEPDIICITESHLNSAIDNNELSIDNYTVFRQDRNFKIKQVTQDALYSADGVDSSDISASGGGGSLIYVKTTLG